MSGRLLIDSSRVPAAFGPAPWTRDQEGCCRGLVGGRGSPQEAGQFTSARDDGHVAGLPAGAHLLVDAVEALLGAVGDLQDVSGLPLLAVS